MKWRIRTVPKTQKNKDYFKWILMANNKCKVFFLLLMAFISGIMTRAQIVEWALEPNFHAIELYADNAYKVTDGQNKSWLINNEGYKIYDPLIENAYSFKYDSISPVIGGYGLLMDYDSSREGWRLRGIFDVENMRIKNIGEKDNFYVDEYGFFSENLMPVRKDNKNYGYISSEGIPVSKFSYEIAMPFSEGKAAVSKSKDKLNKLFQKIANNGPELGNYLYINYMGNENKVAPAVGKKTILCTTFMDGEATVVSAAGQAFRIDDRLQPITIIEQDQIDLDETGVNIKITPNTTIGKIVKPISNSQGIVKIKNGNSFGYSKNGKTLVPMQFLDADEFNGILAPVKTKSGFGIIRLLPDSLSVTVTASPTPAQSDTLENLIVKYNLPMKGNEDIKIADLKGNRVPYSRKSDNELEFVTPKANNIRLTIIGDENLIRLDTLLKTPAFLLIEALNSQDSDSDRGFLKISVSPLSVKADGKKQAVVTVKITNTSTSTQTVPVSISGTGLIGGGSYNVKLAPGQSKTYYPVLTKIVRREKRTIIVKAGDKKISRTIQVNPKAINL